MEKKAARQVLAERLEVLMDQFGVDQMAVALASRRTQMHVSQRTVSNILDPDKHQPQLDMIEAAANVFGLRAWHLLVDPDEVGEPIYNLLVKPKAPVVPPKLRTVRQDPTDTSDLAPHRHKLTRRATPKKKSAK